jgi:VIT1/CCC1 family predicted Fe2+/Mn2+ transporter
MPVTPHMEKHFTASDAVRDVVIGMADGLTVPFALAAGLSGASVANRVVVTAGLAEISAGAIAMGLGGYLAARSDADHYASERRLEMQETRSIPEVESQEVTDIFANYGISPQESAGVVAALRRNRRSWVDFMMRNELGLEKPKPKRAFRSALTIAASYVVGGMIPLAPYMLLGTLSAALRTSILVTMLALIVFGGVKARFTGAKPLRSALQTLLVGGLAAAAAFLIARLIV